MQNKVGKGFASVNAQLLKDYVLTTEKQQRQQQNSKTFISHKVAASLGRSVSSATNCSSACMILTLSFSHNALLIVNENKHDLTRFIRSLLKDSKKIF